MEKLTEGFCFSMRLLDGKSTKVFVNLCGHPDIGLPVTKGGATIEPNWIDFKGIDNLQIPIDVSDLAYEPSDKEPEKKVGFVDVIVNCELTQRCVPSHPLYGHLTGRLIQLALHWVLQETGAKGDPTTVKILQNVKRKMSKKMKEKDAIHRRATQMYQEMLKKTAEHDQKVDSEASTLPDEFNLRKTPGASAAAKKVNPVAEAFVQQAHSTQEDGASPLLRESGKATTSSAAPKSTPSVAAPPQKPSKPLIVELDANGAEVPPPATNGGSIQAAPKTTVVKKGFLNDPSRPSLYGPEGTKEGVVPDGAGDPLGYLPKSLREKCRVVDCTGSDGEVKMRSYMETDSKAPAAPKSSGSTQLEGTKPSIVAPSPAVTASKPAMTEAPRQAVATTEPVQTAAASASWSEEEAFAAEWKAAKKRNDEKRRAAADAASSSSSTGSKFAFFGEDDVMTKALAASQASVAPAPKPVPAPVPEAPTTTTAASKAASADIGNASKSEEKAPLHVTNGITITSATAASNNKESTVEDSLEEMGFVPIYRWPFTVQIREDNADQSATAGELVLTISVPTHITSIANQLDLTIEADSVECKEVDASGSSKPLRIALPRRIDIDTAKAKLVKKSKSLLIIGSLARDPSK
jgi:hypothetical protein